MIIDGHAHCYPDSTAQKIVGRFTEFHRMEPTRSLGTGTVGNLLGRMETAGIDFTVMANFAPEKSLRKTNEWSLEMARIHPRLIPLVAVHPCMSVEEVASYFTRGARGIKMHTGIQGFDPMDDGLQRIYAFAEAKRLPVTFHCGETSRIRLNSFADIDRIVPAVLKWPGIPFVLTHLAAGDPEVALQVATSCPNALFDTSIAFSGEHCIHRIHHDVWENDGSAMELFRKIGCDRIAFGSDYPFGNQASDIGRIRRLNLAEEEKATILGTNTWNIYNCKAVSQ